MSGKTAIAISALALCGACAAIGQGATQAFAQEQADFADVRAIMKGPVNGATMDIWDVGNNAMSDTGGIDAALMDEGKWTRLAMAADKLASAMRGMEAADIIVADGSLGEGEEEDVPPGAVPMADVQRYLDADPAAFRALATGMAEHADRIAQAARLQDADAAGKAVAELDIVCESCHSQFWYPEQ